MCDHSKYTRCSIIVNKVFTQMMQEIIGKSPVHPDQIYQIIMSTNKFKERLKHSEMTTIQTLQTEGFSNLDASLVYKIGKFFNFIPPPTQQWGTSPLSNEIEIGDDIERIRNARNEMVHRKDCGMSDEEMSAFFTEFIAVGERIDVYLNKESGIGFKDSITLYQTCPIDEEMEENAKALQGIESLNEQFQVSVDGKVIHVFYRNSMKVLIEGCRQEDASSSSAVIFVVKGVEDSENKAELLNSLSNQINSDSVAIQLKEAKKDDEQTSTNVEFCDNIEKTDLVLELNVSKDVFSTDESFQKHVGCFIQKVSQMTNEKEALIRSDRIAEMYPVHGRDLKEDIPDNENASDQDRDDERENQERGEKKSHVQIPKEYITGRDLKEEIPDNENSSDQDKDDEKQNQESGENKSYVQIHEEYKTGSSSFQDKNENNYEITDEDDKDRPEITNNSDKVKKQIVKSFLSNVENEFTDKVIANRNNILEGFMRNLGLENFFPDKINLIDVMVVKNPIKKVNYTDIPWIILRSLVMGNFNSRDKMVQEFLEKSAETKQTTKPLEECDNSFESLLDEDENSLSLNPMDLLIILFYCSSPIFKQILAQKLFLCKLAVPICFPSLTSDKISFSTWMLQTIIIDCKSETKGSHQSDITNCPCHTVGFLRLGKISMSKSKVINDVLTDQYHNTFFNKDCPLGTSARTISDGTIECAWILPSDQSEFSSEVVMCLNLRGDGLTNGSQTKILTLVSSIVVVMIDVTLLRKETPRNVLLDLHKSVKGVVIAIDANSVDKNLLKDIYKDYSSRIEHFIKQTEFCMLSREGKATSVSDIKKSIRRSITKLTANIEPTTLSNRLDDKGYTHSEVESKFKECREKAEYILCNMDTRHSNIKDVVPLQGETWRAWTNYNKTLNKSSKYTSVNETETIKQKMLEVRNKQWHICQNVGPFMKSFIDITVKYLDQDLLFSYFIWWLKLLLDDRSRLVLPKYLAEYQKDWQALRSVKNQKQQDVLVSLRKKLNKSEFELAEASFGLEHLVREIGQMYETMNERKFESSCNLDLAINFATIGAKMLLSGQPLELMDGDAANVPLTWVKAVLTELKHMIGDKKLLALSVLGVQSSGKSTLLNTMFGLQFVVSAGRCTRGVFMQLVKVENYSVPVDFIVVIDTEGLRAPELADQKYSHDNELATFVIGLGDITIINIKGENTAEVKDVLQIAVHAFLRLKLANSRLNLKQSCIFVHQNVPASDANDKMMKGRQKFLETLDQMTQEAAEQENIGDIHSFSQVIDFDCNKDVWYLSDLWNGDPPMAPINPGYCRRVEEVGSTILYEIASVRETYLTITDTIARIDDLWKGILKDDFVFSFRNTLELKAYNNMEQKFQELSWKLEKFVSEFVLSEAKGQLIYCSTDEDLANSIPRILKLCSNNVCKQVCVLNNELDTFIDSSSLKDVMIQWKQNKRNRLRILSEVLIDRSKLSILKTKDEIRIEKLRKNAQKSHEMEINQRAQQLATEMRGEKPSGDILKGKFDLMWETWMTEFNTETSEDSVSIQQDIESLIWEKFSADAAFLECQADDSEPNTSMMQIDEYNPIKYEIQSSLKKIYGPEIACNIVQMSGDEFQIFQSFNRLEGSISMVDIADCHIKINRSFFGFGRDKENKNTCKNQTVSSTNILLQKIDTFLKTEIGLKFSVKYAEDIYEKIQRHIEGQNKIFLSTFNFALTPNYGIMVTKHIIRYAIIWFTNLNVNYRRKYLTQSSQNTAQNVGSGSFRKTKPNKKFLKLEGSINTSEILANHISMIKSYKKNWNRDIRNDAIAVTDKMLKKIDTRLAEYNAQDVRFDISFASEILLLISKEIDTHNKHLENIYEFNLLPPYRAMVVIHVQPFITDFFVRLNDRYNTKHSPKGQMKEYKGTVWTLFKNVVDSKAENVIASTFFREALCKAVTEHLDELLPILVQEHIMKSFAHEKYSLMKTIMTDLAEKDEFLNLSLFISDPSEYARIWMNRYIINELFEQEGDNCTTYGRLAQSQIKKILKQLSKCISEASRICRNSEMKDISSWILSFIQHSRELNTIPFSTEDFVHVQNRHVDDLENYIETIIVEMEDIENDIVQPYHDTNQYTVQWKENPISGIMEKLWGCTEKCMFCAEPCRHTGKTHIEEEIPHQCIQHRPQGIGGFHWEHTERLLTEFCNFWMQTDQTYKWGKEPNKETRYYKEYKVHHPDWDIIPSHDTSKYWMWVMCKYPNELKKKYGVEEPNLPETWKIITKEEAIESLSFV